MNYLDKNIQTQLWNNQTRW